MGICSSNQDSFQRLLMMSDEQNKYGIGNATPGRLSSVPSPSVVACEMASDSYADIDHRQAVGLSGRAVHWFWMVALPLILGISGLVIFQRTDWDMRLARSYFDPVAKMWPQGDHGVYLWLLKFGPMPAVFLGVICLIVYLVGSSMSVKLYRYRKPALYFLLCLIIGPGILANAVFKDHWGRPRPEQVSEFGGFSAYHGPLSFDPGVAGKSFPCGHATMGFAFFAFALLFWRSHRRVAWVLIALSVGYGVLIGVARMSQGAHFASDVLMAGVLIWLVSVILYGYMKPDELPVMDERVIAKKPMPRLLAAVLILACGLVSLATPYRSKVSCAKKDTQAKNLEVQCSGSVSIMPGDSFSFVGESSGFGMPASKVKVARLTGEDSFTLALRTSGWFTELNQRYNVTLPIQSGGKCDLVSTGRKSEWSFDLRGQSPKSGAEWSLDTEGRPDLVQLLTDAKTNWSVRWLDTDDHQREQMLIHGTDANCVITIKSPQKPSVLFVNADKASTVQ
jgi:lipid A 4'-phosphatase